MNVVAIIQARLGSARLPGKVLKPIAQYASLYHTVKRTRLAVPNVVLAIPWHDVTLQQFATVLQIPVYQGPLHDVLARYHEAAIAFDADIVVRITGDCPLVDPSLVQRVVAHVEDGAEFASNVWPWRTYPQGLDVEVFTMTLLKRAAKWATTPYDREHVCPYMHQIAKRVECVRQTVDQSFHRWTLDTLADYRFFQALTARLPFEPPHPTTREVLDLLGREPELMTINQETAHFPR